MREHDQGTRVGHPCVGPAHGSRQLSVPQRAGQTGLEMTSKSAGVTAQPETEERQGLGCTPERKLSSLLHCLPGRDLGESAQLWGHTLGDLQLETEVLFLGFILEHIFSRVSVQGIPTHRASLLPRAHSENCCSSHGIAEQFLGKSTAAAA